MSKKLLKSNDYVKHVLVKFGDELKMAGLSNLSLSAAFSRVNKFLGMSQTEKERYTNTTYVLSREVGPLLRKRDEFATFY